MLLPLFSTLLYHSDGSGGCDGASEVSGILGELG